MVAPGTALREGIDNIVHSRTGGLIVIGDPEDISFLFSGGLSLDVDYTPALLYQVAKMDGAIVLNQQATQIVCANVQLMPDPTILSTETGTRHRTAERVSKQTDALVVAISERRDVVSLYLGGMKYILQDIPAVLAKANQGLATLDKYRRPPRRRLRAPHRARVRGRLGPLRRALGPPARRAGDPDGGRGRALHRRARHRGPPDRDAARGDDGRRRRRQGRADPRLLGRGHRGEPRHHALRRSPACRTRTCSTSVASPSCSATTARSRHWTSRSPRAATACSGGSRGCRSWWSSGSSTSSGGWRRSSPQATRTSRQSRASDRPEPRTSARASAGFRRSTPSTGTCRADGAIAVRDEQRRDQFPS